MKKLILSLGVVLTFIAYSFQQRGEGKAAVIAPPGVATNKIAQSPQNSSEGSDDSSSSPTSSNSSSSSPMMHSSMMGQYKNGTYTGSVADAYYGYVQVQATVSGGKISNVQFLQYPNDQQNSRYINSQAMPYLTQEAIQAQSSQVNVISGATDTSMAFIQSLSAALSQAKV